MADEATRYTENLQGTSAADFAADVRDGLSKPGQKELSSKYLYDEVGSALFEVISLLPEYGLTRAGERLLHAHAEEMVGFLQLPVMVAELGSGNGRKTRWILQALARWQPVAYYPIDVSRAALERCRQELGRIDSVSLVGFDREYLDGLLEVAARRKPGEHILVLFLGSSIGNFDRPFGVEFLGRVRAILSPGDTMILATDLEKSVPRTLLAYDDPIGVTAAFNLNVLARINRELEADFDLARFRHQVRWNDRERRIEMHLVSLADQSVNIRKANFSVAFREGETIWTESSHKYNCDEVRRMAEQTGYRCAAQWVDTEWPYAQSLLVAA